MFGIGKKNSAKPQEPKKLWFRAKSYGWGWTPVTWQGWLVVFLYMFCVAYYAKDVGGIADIKMWEKVTSFFIGLGGLSSLLVWICYKKGERPHWSWGQKKDESKNDQ